MEKKLINKGRIGIKRRTSIDGEQIKDKSEKLIDEKTARDRFENPIGEEHTRSKFEKPIGGNPTRGNFEKSIDGNPTRSKFEKPIDVNPTRSKFEKPIGGNPTRGNFEKLIDRESAWKKTEKRINKKHTIVLLEDTFEVAKEGKKVESILNELNRAGTLSVILYGSSVKKISAFDLCEDINFENGKDACLFDALVELETVISSLYQKVLYETEFECINTSSIDIIGIGTCKDNASHVSKEVAIKSFLKVINTTSVNTKYFCITEDSFINAAELGFHSIGAFSSSY